MKLKELTLLFVLALGTQVAFAQQSKSDPTVEFNPHWYGQIQGGVAHTVGETVFKDLLSPAGALSLGYQFNPTLGLRVGASGWQAKGNSIPVEVYKFNFLQGNVDLTFHLANLFGYNHKRVLDPYALIGCSIRMRSSVVVLPSVSRTVRTMSRPSSLPSISPISGTRA